MVCPMFGGEKKKFVQCSIFDVQRSRSNDIDGDKFGSSQKDIDQECGKTETDASVISIIICKIVS